ncbi:mechanosensitive ion channel [Spongiibacter taiwanensis]|uniref:mechanosensitive ion channel domain-containing protein n=1 Tax=Spongiibacter taiwanensis TaxID=1748242 RepID=UPI00203513F2|nr:mechanosensitive ion channel domain-containing protein [Spongiibacter taiwanensis]USA42247.1 mechanosensitive ion channel [Spongiibacter taiwanensis]
MERNTTMPPGVAALIAMLLLGLALFSPAGMAAEEAAGASANGNTADYQGLADLLEDPHSRQVVIEELRALARPQPVAEGEGPDAADIAAQAPSDQQPEEVSLARRMAALTQAIASQAMAEVRELEAAWQRLMDADSSGLEIKAGMTGQQWLVALAQLGALIVGTFAVFALLRRLAMGSFSGLSRWVEQGSTKLAMIRTVVAVIAAAVIDSVVVAASYGIGGVGAAVLAGDNSVVATRLALFLNAFLLVELVKVALRMLFASRYATLRLVPINAAQAGYCNRVFATIAGFVGYGVLLLVPMLNFNIAPAVGALVTAIIVLVAVSYAAGVTLKQRRSIADKLRAMAERTGDPGAILLRILARCWHLLVLFYLAVVLVISISHPETALPWVALASAKTLGYAGVGLLLSVVLGQVIGREIGLSDRLNQRLPRLQPRINRYVPTSLRVARGLILVVVAALVLDAWAVFDLAAWYQSDLGGRTLSASVDIGLILVAATLVWVVLASLIEHRLTPAPGAEAAAAARAETLRGLFTTTLAIVILIMTVMIVLSEIGVDIAPLIAGAGVLGLAVGFGAQKLVQDVITGIFIQLENAMNTGDFVSAGGNSGTVERVGIRSVALRDLYGTYHIVPFSSVGAVSNYTREFGNHVGEYGIAYRENIDEAITALHAAFEELKTTDIGSEILAPLNVAGVVALADSSVNIRAVIKTTPGNQWAVGRAYNRLVKMHFDRAGIEIPFPHTTLYFGEDKDGSAPAANLRLDKGSAPVG